MTTLASDDFATIGTGDIYDRTPVASTIGAKWRRKSGTSFGGDGAGRVTPGNDGSAASLDTGASNLDITVDVTFVGTVSRFSVGAREQSTFGATSEAGYSVWNTDASNIRLSWFDSSATRTDYAAVSAGVTFTTGVTYTMRLVLDGSSIKFYVNGVERISQTDSNVTSRPHATIGGLPTGGTYGDARYDNFVVADLAAGDTENPTLTGTPTVGTKTSSSIQITGPAGSDNVGITAYEFSTDGGATWPLSSPTLPYNITGLSAGTSYTIGMRAKDAAGNTSTPAIFVTESTVAIDTTPPTMNGSITVGTKTSGSISISYPAASDNVAVTGYEVSSNGGSTWSDNGASLSYTFLGLAALTSYNLRVRAYDAAGNRAATPLAATTSTYRAGDTAANILANTGPIGAGQPGFLYAFASTVTSTDWLSYTIVSGPTPSGGTLNAQPDGRFTYTGPAPATMVIQPEVNGVNAAETITVTLYDAAPDTELPVLTGSITVTSITSTGYNLSWPTGTDNTGVAGYEYSLNGGSSWADNGNVTTKAITGRTPESTDEVRVRAYDAAGNKSTPALATSVTLLAAPDVTEPTLTLPTGYASGPTTASGTVTTNEATGTLYFLRNTSVTATKEAVKAGLSQPVTASGIQTVNVTGLTASTTGNRIHYLHRDAAGNDSLVSSSDAFATPAAPAPGLKVIGAQPTKLIARPITRPIVIGQTD